MYCPKCGRIINDDAAFCTNCGYKNIDKTSTTVFVDSKELTYVFKFWSMHPLTIIAVVIWTLLIFFSFSFSYWVVACISFLIGYYMAKEWSPRINGSQSWAFAIGFFFGIFGLIGYWLYYRHKLGNPSLQMSPPKREGDGYDLNTKNFKNWYNKGVDFSQLNEYENALQAYNQAIGFNDKDPDVWNNKCYVLIKLGRYDEAINAGKIGVSLAPNDPGIWDILRDAYLANRNPEKAAECYNKISTLQSRSAVENTEAEDICYGLISLVIIVIALINISGTIGKSTSGLIYGVIFLILLIGILYEGWKAITQ